MEGMVLIEYLIAVPVINRLNRTHHQTSKILYQVEILHHPMLTVYQIMSGNGVNGPV